MFSCFGLIIQAIETFKECGKRDSKMAGTAATNLSFVLFLVRKHMLKCAFYHTCMCRLWRRGRSNVCMCECECVCVCVIVIFFSIFFATLGE